MPREKATKAGGIDLQPPVIRPSRSGGGLDLNQRAGRQAPRRRDPRRRSAAGGPSDPRSWPLRLAQVLVSIPSSCDRAVAADREYPQSLEAFAQVGIES